MVAKVLQPAGSDGLTLPLRAFTSTMLAVGYQKKEIMLVRVYRLTDKSGLVLLKLTALFTDWLLAGVSRFVGLFRSGSGGMLRAVLGLLLLAAGLVLAVLRTIGRTLRALLRLLGRLFASLLRLGGYAGRGAVRVTGRQTAVLGGTVADSATRSMARRKARAELDVKLVEDPLRVQNRVLSVLIIVLVGAVIAVVLWATDPSRGAQTAASPDSDVIDLFAPAATADAGQQVSAALLSTPIPTATQIPAALQVRGAVAYVVREKGQTDLWAVNIGSRTPIRLTNDPSDERDPVWSPDGTRLAYASRRDGNWELYVYEMDTQSTTRLTYDLSFQGRPSWSPDGLWLAYETYQGNNLNIYAMRVDGSQLPIPIVDHPAADFSPAWSPDGRHIAFTSTRDGSLDIHIVNLDSQQVYNLTNTPTRDEDYPAWSPDGRYVAFSALEQGVEKVFVQPMNAPGQPARVISFGRMPSWSPDGSSLIFVVDALDGSSSFLYAVPFSEEGVATEVIPVPYGSASPVWTERPLPPQLVNAGGLPPGMTDDLYTEQFTRYTTGAPYRLSPLPDVQVANAALSDRVNDSFSLLRQRVAELTGRDYLGQLEDAFWDINRPPQPGEDPRSWHKTGRAFGLTRSLLLGFPPLVELVREDMGVNTYWRVYLRVTDEEQSGQLGEPLRRLPWDLLSRTSGDVEAHNQGGRVRLQMPQGYYVDFTRIAMDYDWQWMPAGSDWRGNANTVNWWLYRKTDGLDWYAAMLEIYTESQLGGFVPTPTPAPFTASDS